MSEVGLVRFDLVLVEWVDSHSGRGWENLDNLKANCDLLYCRSVGWLVAKNRDAVTLVSNLSGESNDNVIVNGNGYMTIPARAVRKVTVLRKGGGRYR